VLLLLPMGIQGRGAQIRSRSNGKVQISACFFPQVWHLHKQAPETTWLTHGLDWVTAGEFIAFLVFSCHGRAHVFKLTADLLASAADAIYANLEGHVSTDSTLFKPLPFKRLDPAFKEQLAEAAKMHDLPLALTLLGTCLWYLRLLTFLFAASVARRVYICNGVQHTDASLCLEAFGLRKGLAALRLPQHRQALLEKEDATPKPRNHPCPRFENGST
jgi:hypothetical protein